ncbi:hypothetical protein MIJ3_00266 [Pseudomonas phage vB_PaeM_MIJ3]|nr:hypothetical protein MIJ3_00266 [Pseudomonas phage vB_PaeM_MIJ3]
MFIIKLQSNCDKIEIDNSKYNYGVFIVNSENMKVFHYSNKESSLYSMFAKNLHINVFLVSTLCCIICFDYPTLYLEMESNRAVTLGINPCFLNIDVQGSRFHNWDPMCFV